MIAEALDRLPSRQRLYIRAQQAPNLVSPTSVQQKLDSFPKPPFDPYFNIRSLPKPRDTGNTRPEHLVKYGCPTTDIAYPVASFRVDTQLCGFIAIQKLVAFCRNNHILFFGQA